MASTTKSKNTGLGLLLLGASGAFFFFAWKTFEAVERTNLGVLRTCADEAKGLGQETLSYYGQCLELLQSGNIGVWILIVVGVVLGFIGLINLAGTSN